MNWVQLLVGGLISAAIATVPTLLILGPNRGKYKAESAMASATADNSTAAEMRQVYALVERQRDEAREAARQSDERATLALQRANVCARNLMILSAHLDSFEAWALAHVPNGVPPPPARPPLLPIDLGDAHA